METPLTSGINSTSRNPAAGKDAVEPSSGKRQASPGTAAEGKPSPGGENADRVTIGGTRSASAAAELTQEEQQVVEQLKSRDREVRAHEQAHAAAAGPNARGGPQFEYQTGPDGKRYAVGGEVAIDTSPVPGNPSATIQKAQTIRRAALAPAEPSAQDRRVAAESTRLEADARQELARERTEKQKETREKSVSENQPGEPNGGDGSTPGKAENPASTNGPAQQAIRQFANPSAQPGDLLDIFS